MKKTGISPPQPKLVRTTRYCAWCGKPISPFDFFKRICHGIRQEKGTCAWHHRRKTQRPYEIRRRGTKNEYLKEYRKTHPPKRQLEYRRKWRAMRKALGLRVT